MNVIARLEYELAYYDSAVHRFNHYTTRTPPIVARPGTPFTSLSESDNLCNEEGAHARNEDSVGCLGFMAYQPL